MAGKKFEALSHAWRCQICDQANLHGKKNFSTDIGLALHITEEWTKPHEDWRVEHGFPVRCKTLGEVNRVARQILPLIQSWKLG